MIDIIIGGALFISAFFYAHYTYKNPPSGSGSAKLTYLIKDYYAAILLFLLSLLLLFGKISLIELIN